jgi:hypothetical protein
MVKDPEFLEFNNFEWSKAYRDVVKCNNIDPKVWWPKAKIRNKALIPLW